MDTGLIGRMHQAIVVDWHIVLVTSSIRVCGSGKSKNMEVFTLQIYGRNWPQKSIPLWFGTFFRENANMKKNWALRVIQCSHTGEQNTTAADFKVTNWCYCSQEWACTSNSFCWGSPKHRLLVAEVLSPNYEDEGEFPTLYTELTDF